MKTQDINIILQEFDAIENISPSSNWDLVLEQKLKNFTISKKNTKLNFAMLLLAIVNVGFIMSSLTTSISKTTNLREENFKTISEQLLNTDN